MANPEHLKILERGVKVWNEWRQRYPSTILNFENANLQERKLRNIDLRGVNLKEADLRRADLSNAELSKANLSGADLCEAKFMWANLIEVDLSGASLDSADFYDADMEQANLRNADLHYCYLIRSNLSNAILTGANLYGTARDDWIIRDIQCQYIYWDEHGEQRSPKDRDLEPGEFEMLYAALPTIEYIFEHGMLPIDPLIMDRVVQAIQEKQPEFDIKIDSINARGHAPSIKFTVKHEDHKEIALQQVQKEYEIKLNQLESERDRYYQLIARALDVPKEIKLINAAPGSIVATDGSTISIENHIHNALQLHKTIANEPEDSESFAGVAKKTALDIIGEAMKDIAKGQVKKAAKQIIELGKDLGPLLIRMAPVSYQFFQNLGT